MEVKFASAAAELERCFPVIIQLRPHLDCHSFVEQVQRQTERESYRLVYVEDAGKVKAVAGFRMMEKLSSGRSLYVDDLVTAERVRSNGYGEFLINWLIDYAKSQNCNRFALDSGVQRSAAHRFYFRHRLEIVAYCFERRL